MLDASRLERVKPPLVRAWFDTVFSPLLYGLRMEADALGVGNLSWQGGSRFRMCLLDDFIDEE
jgi:hypothetical protein